jgi:DNA-binding XRE family transcriptional regulator
MSVRTKTLPTEAAQCTLAFLGPRDQAEAAREALAALGFVETEGIVSQERIGSPEWIVGQERLGDEASASPVPWRTAFPPLSEAARPGRMLRAARTKEALSQLQLAGLTGIPQRHISAMEHGKRTIGRERAKKLAEVLQVDYRLFL